MRRLLIGLLALVLVGAGAFWLLTMPRGLSPDDLAALPAGRRRARGGGVLDRRLRLLPRGGEGPKGTIGSSSAAVGC